ncbi:ABC transporter substrate-binding protein [Bradyrhizobium sp. SZCCHNRI1009]|uniref:ABC transporter substrate-binding protein n=1 Tax=Bradyrhizobium sp. SZCCHNRI1009 TaxID=3057277 RepID=UPI0029169265|nr:ABC transporter substrate-binding protein [Bradyrhizobium sp. SZCCHNRI1009]
MAVRWSTLIIGSVFAAPFSPALAAAPDVVRELGSRVGPIVGQASACPDIAQGRVQGMVDKFREAIRQATRNDGERDQLTRSFNGYIAEGRSRTGASQATCAAAERQLTELERSLGEPAAATAPITPVKAETTTGAVTAGPVRGITDREIRFGMVLPFSGIRKETGRQMRQGIEAAFARTNDAGGVNGRMLRLVAADDGYDPNRTLAAMTQLYDKEQVFGFIGNVGTANSQVAIPYALERRTLFFAPNTGAAVVRRDPPDRYVFNYRASYAEETAALVRYLIRMKRVSPKQIAVFTQQDPFGDDGYTGVAKAYRQLNIGDTVTRINYPRATMDVEEAVNQVKAHKPGLKAIIMVATDRAAAKFIEKTRDAVPGLIYANVSAVGSTSLATELKLLGPRFTNGVIVTQGVPAVSGYSSLVLDYKNALAKYAPGEGPDYTSLEGYIAATILIQALKQTNPLDTERLIDTLESMRSLDLGLGTTLAFGRAEHQASHKIWGTALDETGTYQAIELE